MDPLLVIEAAAALLVAVAAVVLLRASRREAAQSVAELQTVLAVLDEAVIVQRPDGALVYANDAAARMLGLEGRDELVDAGRAWEGWDVRDEHGEPVTPEVLPGRRALAGERAPEPLLLRVTSRETGAVFWRLVKASPVPDRHGRPRLAVIVIEDHTEARREEIAQRFLAQASKLLSSSLDVGETLEKVAWAAVPHLADWCAVDMPDAHGRMRRVATADVQLRRRQRGRLVVGESARAGALPVGPPQVMATGRPELHAHIGDELLRSAARDTAQFEALRAAGPLSALVVPLISGNRVIGTITLGTTTDSGRRLAPADLELAEELGRRAGVAVDHAQMHDERARIATTLQEALLPPRLPVIPGLSIAARFRAAGEAARVGGDFYDLFAVDGAWMVMIGDVTGKGAPAAAITSLARYTMRTAAKYERSPAAILARLNEALCADAVGESQLCTAQCLRIAPRGAGGADIVVASAGHPPAMLARPSGEVVEVTAPGTLLGAFELGAWRDRPVDLGAGETLLLYTDGVTDTRGREERFGLARLGALLGTTAGVPADALAARIDETLLGFQDGEQRDDVALLVLQATGDAAETTISGAAPDIVAIHDE